MQTLKTTGKVNEEQSKGPRAGTGEYSNGMGCQVDDVERLLGVARASTSAREVADRLGLDAAHVSRRLYQLRQRGVPGVPTFKRGRPRRLPKALRVLAWRWVKFGDLVHRQALGEEATICGRGATRRTALDLVSDYEATSSRCCSACWPVVRFPPKAGLLPAPGTGIERVIAEQAPGRARSLNSKDGSAWFDERSGEDLGDVVPTLRWWAIAP